MAHVKHPHVAQVVPRYRSKALASRVCRQVCQYRRVRPLADEDRVNADADALRPSALFVKIQAAKGRLPIAEHHGMQALTEASRLREALEFLQDLAKCQLVVRAAARLQILRERLDARVVTREKPRPSCEVLPRPVCEFRVAYAHVVALREIDHPLDHRGRTPGQQILLPWTTHGVADVAHDCHCAATLDSLPQGDAGQHGRWR
mmetsp:Transcript_118068/g.286457  ORF Transcript_118068/g.286457 Transcript_118068/m.286457 type:complete len:204 (+) Transcript_118068:74-685(+)